MEAQQARVAVAKQESYDPTAIGEKLLTLLSGLNLLEKLQNKTVLLKPNCTGVFTPAEARTTHPAVVEALAVLLLENNSRVIIGESSSVGVPTPAAYAASGLEQLGRDLDLRLVDFKRSRYIDYFCPHGLVLRQLRLPEEAVRADVVISLAKLKTNYATTLSCALKNMKGLLCDEDKRDFHHLGLAAAITDMYAVLREELHTVAIVDGIVGSELYEPRSAGVLVASADLAACDAVCARLMGLSPLEADYLALAERRGLCRLPPAKDLSSYVPASPPFRTVNPDLQALADRFGIEIFDAHPCSSCIGALHHTLQKVHSQRPELLSGLQLAVGACEHVDGLEQHIRFGLCARGAAPELNVIGCCPTSSDFISIVERLRG